MTSESGSKSDRSRRAAAKAPKCPICGKVTDPGYRPFCSKRCSDIDLGRWLGGRYVVPGEPVSTRIEEEDEG